jgi:hypothetical protein
MKTQSELSDEQYDENVTLVFNCALDDIESVYPFDCVTESDWPLLWCETAFPGQYRRQTRDFPERIAKMLNRRARIGELVDVLSEWVGLHVWLYAQYRNVRRHPPAAPCDR